MVSRDLPRASSARNGVEEMSSLRRALALSEKSTCMYIFSTATITYFFYFHVDVVAHYSYPLPNLSLTALTSSLACFSRFACVRRARE